ncbi:DUF308 domain-containing protein [Methanobacterium alcaliphilum]|uniref:DUF308 domain-containing protein n=1 Tax=Methanobacterium alcaliphilum TaxID=392018 RepID=UPI00200B30BB|nr:DUF308 domain-containing protein [Methanobacterium alcaliphilum]MCK9151561.1 DUF308 domain-containing protein [Methanobacterium alcaliphilum]
MANKQNQLLGILGIILGFFVISFPIISAYTASIFAGFGLLLLGIWLMALSFDSWGYNNIGSLSSLIIGLLSIVIGIGIMGNVEAFDVIVDYSFYLVGIFLIYTGVMELFVYESFHKFVGAIGIITGALYIILAITEFDTTFLIFTLGLWLIFAGALQFFKEKTVINSEDDEEPV